MKQLAWQSAAVAKHEAETVDVFIDLGGVQTGELPLSGLSLQQFGIGLLLSCQTSWSIEWFAIQQET